MLCKICPTCNNTNDQNELICKSCLTPIDSVAIVDCNKKEELQGYIEFVFDGYSQKLFAHDIVGRDGKAKEFLKDKLTVSREHLEIQKEEEMFYIVDKNSTNGTYLNGEKIKPNTRKKIKNSDKISLSKQVTCKVKI